MVFRRERDRQTDSKQTDRWPKQSEETDRQTDRDGTGIRTSSHLQLVALFNDAVCGNANDRYGFVVGQVRHDLADQLHHAGVRATGHDPGVGAGGGLSRGKEGGWTAA